MDHKELPDQSANPGSVGSVLPAFVSFAEFTELVRTSAGMLVFMMTSDCGGRFLRRAARFQQSLGSRAMLHLVCARVAVPRYVVYRGGDPMPLTTREGRVSERALVDAVIEAQALAELRIGAAATESELKHTETMLESENLDRFPSLFRMSRNLARDAWQAARATTAGAPLLVESDTAAQRLDICALCPMLKDERCLKCGCYMPVKAHIAAMCCPIGKWPAVISA